MSEGDNGERPFIPVADKIETKKFLQDAVKSMAACTIWTRNQEFLIRSFISYLADREQLLFCWRPKELDVESFKQSMKKNGVNDSYFSVSLSTANVFFRSYFVREDENGLCFEVPQLIYKVQRRKDFRMPIPDGYTAILAFLDPLSNTTTLRKKILDISAGGLAILVEDTEMAMFTNGMSLGEGQFKIKNRPIFASFEVRHIRMLAQTTPGKVRGTKVGLQFTQIAEKDVQFIAAYVFEESRKYFTRLA